MKIITRSIVFISLISLFTDISSEMLYPIMPIYLKSIGFSIVLIGILEGLAEATAGLSKGYFGKLSDNMGKRVPFVRIGYILSAISKPMMALFVFPLWIFFARTIDRLSKGIRTGARDAMLSDETTPEHKGQVFGFHRGMDTLGAAIGPTAALVFLYFYPAHYKEMFFLAFIPAFIAILITFFLKEKKSNQPIIQKNTSFFSFLKYWKEGTTSYRHLVIGLLAFTLFNSSDVFLILMIKQHGFDDQSVIMVYIFYNLVYALLCYPMGKLGDKFGLKPTFVFGLIVFCLVYAAMAFNTNIYVYYFLFFLYGMYAVSTEGISKAWITNVCEKKDTATAIGTYSAFNSIASMVSSTLAGVIWYKFSPETMFIFSAVGAIGVVLYFLMAKKQ